jgi:hypothetical protein
MAETPTLPPGLLALLDGSDLEGKVGETLVLIATDADGWPRVATLSVGELLAVSGTQLLVTLYRSSRTTLAIVSSGRALLVAVEGDGIAKVQLQLEALDVASPGRTTFRAQVVSVEHDEVPYARVTHGIGFELVDGTRAVERWRLQLADLRALAETP